MTDPRRPGVPPAVFPIDPSTLANLAREGVTVGLDPWGRLAFQGRGNALIGPTLSGDASGQVGATVEVPGELPAASARPLIKTSGGENRNPCLITAQFSVVERSFQNQGPVPSSAVVQAVLEWGTGGGTAQAVVTLKHGLSVVIAATYFGAKVYREPSNPIAPAAEDNPVSVAVNLNYGSHGSPPSTGPVYEKTKNVAPAASEDFPVTAFAGSFSVLASSKASLLLSSVQQFNKAGALLAEQDIRSYQDARHIPVMAGAWLIKVTNGGAGAALFTVIQELGF